MSSKDLERRRATARKYHKNKDPEIHYQNSRRANYKRFGLTIDDFSDMNNAQNGLCAICEGPPIAPRRYLSVDHNNFTGQVRALLCDKCNCALGLLQHSVSLAEAALAYLKTWEE